MNDYGCSLEDLVKVAVEEYQTNSNVALVKAEIAFAMRDGDITDIDSALKLYIDNK